MGAGASASQQREEMTQLMPKCSDYIGCFEILDESGEGIDLQQLIDGIAKMGLKTFKKEDIPALFKKFKAEAPAEKGRGWKKVEPKITVEEFMRFCIVEHSAKFSEEEDAGAIRKKYTDLHGLLGPIEATHGFVTAINVLKKTPELASIPFQYTIPSSEIRPQPATCSWLPLHMVLLGGGNSMTIKMEGLPLIKALLRAYPDAAKERVMAGGSLIDGHLPLYLALQCGWGIPVIKALIAEHPMGMTSMDMQTKYKKKNGSVPAPNKKKCKWARKIAEECQCPDEIVELLYDPRKAKKKELGQPGVTGKFKWIQVTTDEYIEIKKKAEQKKKEKAKNKKG